MTTQILAAAGAADPINFESYAAIYEQLNAARWELDEAICEWYLRCLFPSDQELTVAWPEVDAANRSLTEFLDAADDRYSLPTSPKIKTCRTMSLHYWEREPFDNHELLGELFPPAARPELEALVVCLRDVLMAYFDRLMATLRRLLYGTRIHEGLVNARLRPMDLSAWLSSDLANINRFQLFLSAQDDAFENFAGVSKSCKVIKTVVDDMTYPFQFIENPRSKDFRLLKRYITRADRFREEVLEEFADRFSLHVRRLPNLNPRWSYPGEPAYFAAERAAQTSPLPAQGPPQGRSTHVDPSSSAIDGSIGRS